MAFLQIVGPLNDNVEALFGGYAPDPDPSYITTPRVGLSSLGKQVLHADGCKDGDTSCSDYNADSIKQAVTGADLVIVNLGTGKYSKDQYHYDQYCWCYELIAYCFKCICADLNIF